MQPAAIKGRLLPYFDLQESVKKDIVGSVITSNPRANACVEGKKEDEKVMGCKTKQNSPKKKVYKEKRKTGHVFLN